MKNKIMVFITSLWFVLSFVNESGILDIIPIENEDFSKWVKWGVAFIIMIANAIIYIPKKSIGGGGIPNPKK